MIFRLFNYFKYMDEKHGFTYGRDSTARQESPPGYARNSTAGCQCGEKLLVINGRI
jgi:hypothetical protein